MRHGRYEIIELDVSHLQWQWRSYRSDFKQRIVFPLVVTEFGISIEHIVYDIGLTNI